MTDIIATFHITIEDKNKEEIKQNQITLHATQGDVTLPLPVDQTIELGAHVLTCRLANGQWQALSIHPIAGEAKPAPKKVAPTPRVGQVVRSTTPAPGSQRRTPPPLGESARKQATLVTPPVAVQRAATRGTTPAVAVKTIEPKPATPSARSIVKAATKPNAARGGGFSQATLPIPEAEDARISTPDVKKRDPVIHATGIDDWDEDDVILF